MVTGGSVVALKYKGGVMVAADTLASYGSLARYEGVSRIAKVGISNDTMLAAGGDYSDYQMILKMIEQKAVADFAADDGSSLSPKAMHHWLTRVMYNRRSKMDPLWNAVIVTGFRDGKAYLGSSDLYGTMFEDDYVATGLGGHLALPLIRKAWHAEMSEEEARKLLVDCMRVLFYRDTRASASIQLGTVSAEGSKVGEPFKLDTFWECAAASPPPPPPSRPPPPAAPTSCPLPLPHPCLARLSRACALALPGTPSSCAAEATSGMAPGEPEPGKGSGGRSSSGCWSLVRDRSEESTASSRWSCKGCKRLARFFIHSEREVLHKINTQRRARAARPRVREPRTRARAPAPPVSAARPARCVSDM